jgi:hypothetical protein
MKAAVRVERNNQPGARRQVPALPAPTKDDRPCDKAAPGESSEDRDGPDPSLR